VLRAADALRMLPCAPESHVDVVPADWVAEMLVGLLTKPTLRHDLYHLSAGMSGRTTWAEVIAAFEAAEPSDGVRAFRPFDLAADRTVLRRRFAEVFGLDGPLKQAMLRAVRAYYAFCALDVTFANDRLLAEGFAPAPRLPAYLPVCLANAATIVEQFADDIEMFAVPPPVPEDAAGTALAASA
jgi:hypothetical protein